MSKLYDSDFIHMLSKYDIVCLQETFVGALPNNNDVVILSGYMHFWSPALRLSSDKHHKGRLSGGVLVLINNKFKNYVALLKNNIDNCVTIRINRVVFNTDNDIILVNIYIPPYNSPFYNQNDYRNGVIALEQCICDLDDKGFKDLIVCGDLNSRTSNVQPFIGTSDINFIEHNQDLYDDCNYWRQSEDSEFNTFGKYLIELCSCFNLVILNGTVSGDKEGKFTNVTPTGNSVVDYIIVSESIYNSILNLNILTFTLSWHLPLSLTINTSSNIFTQEVETIKGNLQPMSYYVKWNENKSSHFIENLMSDCCKNLSQRAIFEIDLNHNMALSLFSETLLTAASDMIVTPKNKYTENKYSKWFDNDCKNMRNTINRDLKRYQNSKSNVDKVRYVNNRKHYKNLIKEKRAIYNNNKVTYIKNNMNNQSVFWSEIKKVCRKNRTKNNITPNSWINHFKSLHTPLSDDLPPICKEPNSNLLTDNYDYFDSPITDMEINKGINRLKPDKSPGPDGIVAELLKASLNFSTSFLTKYCNHIFNNALFPIEWSKSILLPIHKKGDVNTTDNYRGVSLGSVLSKVYTFIINERLNEWSDQQSIYVEEQAGFRKKNSCTDQIYCIYSMVQKQFSSNRKLYVAFVDFKKAFDFVHREALWHVLKKSGMNENSKILNALKAVYSKVQCAVCCDEMGISEYFDCSVGVKQGCILSPTLFNLFINELAKEVSTLGKHGVQLVANSREIFLLLFADDIALISVTPVGLQNQLNILEKQAKRLGLKVNLDKAKIMVFRKGGFLGRNERWTFE